MQQFEVWKRKEEQGLIMNRTKEGTYLQVDLSVDETEKSKAMNEDADHTVSKLNR